MLVYRIEDSQDEDGRGPWWSDIFYEEKPFAPMFNAEFNLVHSETFLTHPAPHSDGIPFFNPNEHFCACESLAQLSYWFGQGALPRLLNDAGFILRVYEVDQDKVLFGNNQIAFEKGCSSLKEEYNILEKLS